MSPAPPLPTLPPDRHPGLPARPRGPLASAALAATLVLCSPATWAADAVRSAADIESTYRSERQACEAGRTGQDRDTCLKEAAAARQQGLSHQLDNGETAAQRQHNALARCDATPPADREACQRLARGEGRRSGSVAGGGVLKQLTTRSAVAPGAASRVAPLPVSAASAAPWRAASGPAMP